MRLRSCIHEKEIAELLQRGHWPQACPTELRAHAEQCPACSERILVTQAFRRERASAAAAARLESPGVLWWRAQLRRRNAALERIARPMLGAQIFTIVLALVAAGVFLASQARQGRFSGLAHTFNLAALVPAPLQNSPGIVLLVGILLAAIALAGGFVAYSTSEKR
ncbi:MAG TPA: hypothetical protein VG225_06885 [Terracidiphilus sp.]|jgi:hypothetical protein|nr:hypothetical protein [Terracidiphilus sp.]